MNPYPDKVSVIGVPVISGAWMIPSHPHPGALIVSPVKGMNSEELPEVTLSIVSVPLPQRVIPVPVEPLRYTEP